MSRSADEWRRWCERIEVGYVPCADRLRTFDNGVEFVDQKLRSAGLWTADDLVLEVGSGNGRIAMGLCEEPIRYVGLEPIRACVEFCREAFEEYDTFTFEHFDDRNSHYNPAGAVDAADAVFPVDDNSVDLVILASVFSHMETCEGASQYLDEIYRVLKPGGKVYSTWFRSPPNEVTTDATRTVYPADWILQQVHRRFRLWDAKSGATRQYHDQWEMIGIKDSNQSQDAHGDEDKPVLETVL
jgi:SAM-dependent methyltransferase